MGTLEYQTNSLFMLHIGITHISRLMGKPTICIGENKGADQLRGNRGL